MTKRAFKLNPGSDVAFSFLLRAGKPDTIALHAARGGDTPLTDGEDLGVDVRAGSCPSRRSRGGETTVLPRSPQRVVATDSQTVGCSRTSTRKNKGPRSHSDLGPSTLNPGSDLLSHTPTHAVPSAVAGLTSVFGMGTGGTLPL